MEEGNSLRDTMKDAIGEHLREESDDDKLITGGLGIDEMAAELADVVFDVMFTPEVIQDMSYEMLRKRAEARRLTRIIKEQD